MAEFIEKQEALDGMRQLPHEYKTKEQRARTGGIAACQMVVKNIEPADVRPVVRGRWLMDRDPGEPWKYTWKYKCDQCGEVTNNTCMGKPRYNYCPMCGADMREEAEE